MHGGGPPTSEVLSTTGGLSSKWRRQTERRRDSAERGVTEWNGNTSAASWQQEERVGEEGCLGEGGSSTWGQNGGHKPPSSGSQKQEDTGATVPIEVFVSEALSCFSSANRGYNEGGMLPSPRPKRLSILDLSEPEWPNKPSHENQVSDLLPPGSPSWEVADSYNFNK